MKDDNISLNFLIQAANDRSFVKGLTHEFYNYPARFSPKFAREAIKYFTNEGDLVIDPFMGGGTTLVEAKFLHRHALGFDISNLAHFISSVKLTPLSEKEITYINWWKKGIFFKLNNKARSLRPDNWIEAGYQKNLSDKFTWHLRKLFEQYIYEVEKSKTNVKVKNFLRCALLKTGQWALDSRKSIPPLEQFKEKLKKNIEQMLSGIIELHSAKTNNSLSFLYNKPAIRINQVKTIKKFKPPKLILTSPPYPGIHVVYHRWQIHGKKETPAPFWITNSMDGHGLTHYTMGNRQQPGLYDYFENIKKTFSAISKVCSKDTILIQILAFSDPEWQLDKYNEVMELSGFKEFNLTKSRIWREVPNRKWYAQNKGDTPSSKEVILAHKLIS